MTAAAQLRLDEIEPEPGGLWVLCDWLEERGWAPADLRDLRSRGGSRSTAEVLRRAYLLGREDRRALDLARRAATPRQVAVWLIERHADEMGRRYFDEGERGPPVGCVYRDADGRLYRQSNMRTPRGVYASRFLRRKSDARRFEDALAMVRDGSMWRLPTGRKMEPSDWRPFDTAEAWLDAREWLTAILDDLGLLEVRP